MSFRLHFSQDAGKLFSALHGCVSRIPHEHLKRVVRIAICGQMHGIMFWKHGAAWSWTGSDDQVSIFKFFKSFVSKENLLKKGFTTSAMGSTLN